MKARLLIISLILVGTFVSIHAVPDPDSEHAFRHSEIVIEGRILSADIISEPVVYRTEDTYYEKSGIVVYEVHVEKSLKNPENIKVITVAGHFLREPHPMAFETHPYETGQKILMYLQENTHGDGGTDLIILSSTSKVIDKSIDSVIPEPSPSTCKSGPAPEGHFVFFDCNWVEVPDHWDYKNGKWQEDPSVLKLGPEPDPVCPDVGVCTCPGKFHYYNFTDSKCYSSPYIPTYYQNACKQYVQLDFPGWNFNNNACDWVSASDPYENDESMRLVSEKIDVGGLGINFSDYDTTSTVTVGIVIGGSLGFGLLFYWRKRK